MKTRSERRDSPSPATGSSDRHAGREAQPHLSVVSWNLTMRCNLRCAHCYLDAGNPDDPHPQEPSTEQAFFVVERIAETNPNILLILTGGEPLLRRDLFDISRLGVRRGLSVVVGTNGTLLTDRAVDDLKGSGVQGVGISLDSLKPEVHDRFRGVPGSWSAAIRGMERLSNVGIPFTLQSTVTDTNFQEIENLAGLAEEMGAVAFNVFFLVCTGRGQKLVDITPQQYEGALKRIASIRESYMGKMFVASKCAPHYSRVQAERAKDLNPSHGGAIRFDCEGNPDGKVRLTFPGGCPAGIHYCRITPRGDVTPCPYIDLVVGNLYETHLTEIWGEGSLFKTLREGQLAGRCGDCEYRRICRGCRARAYATTGDLLGEDPWCDHRPSKDKAEPFQPCTGFEIAEKPVLTMDWTPEALERLDAVPSFVREVVIKRVESFAVARGCRQITPELMKEVRKEVGR